MCPCYWLFYTAIEKKQRGERDGGQAVDQHPYEFVFVVWHPERVHKSIDFSYPVSALHGTLRYRGCHYFQVPLPPDES